ncbi:Mal regulon transcriptional regulator MalI [Thaumasiovibrio subtropicus]|uniref:Mal regulon transcriptional regulator MalI n=1 Tax=Thaumasiovibrio subtropicus TaxID=1891207 RepID=UPI000B354843|nr:Mal regulon transcriptional regulator MalI [Thaumasiovibrio subtropicus]
MSSKRVKITDVAAHAGVSVTTVSMVLGNKGRISDATIAKVNQAVEELGYRRNTAAANLRSNQSNLIGLILRDISDPYYSEVTAGIAEAIEKQGYMLFLAQCGQDGGKLEQCVQSMLQHDVAGIIFTPIRGQSESVIRTLRDANVPAATIGRALPEQTLDYIGPDNNQAARLATRYLVDKGHRHIAYLGGTSDSLTRAERIGGYCATLMQYGLPFKNEWIIECDNHPKTAKDACADLLHQHPKITAVVCHRPAVATGALYGIKQVGRNVGKDNYIGQQVAVISFDDSPEAELTYPSLSVVKNDERQIGIRAGEQLLARMKQSSMQAETIIMPSQLVERESA